MKSWLGFTILQVTCSSFTPGNLSWYAKDIQRQHQEGYCSPCSAQKILKISLSIAFHLRLLPKGNNLLTSCSLVGVEGCFFRVHEALEGPIPPKQLRDWTKQNIMYTIYLYHYTVHPYPLYHLYHLFHFFVLKTWENHMFRDPCLNLASVGHKWANLRVVGGNHDIESQLRKVIIFGAAACGSAQQTTHVLPQTLSKQEQNSWQPFSP